MVLMHIAHPIKDKLWKVLSRLIGLQLIGVRGPLCYSIEAVAASKIACLELHQKDLDILVDWMT